MALSHVSKIFAVKDIKVTKLLTDPAGGTATYNATSVDIVGAKSMPITGTIDAKELRGDNTLLDAQAVWRSMHVAITHGKVNLDALSVFFTTAVADTGTTPNQVATWAAKNTDLLNYFKIEGQAVGADAVAGDVHFVIWKAILASFPALGLTEEDYTIPAFEAAVIPRISDGSWVSIVLNETAVAIP